MKKLIILFLILVFNAGAQSPSWVWARSFGGSQAETGAGAAQDPSGNTFVTGYFSSNSFTIGTNTLNVTSALKGDIFVAKYDPAGNVLWAKSFGGSEVEDSRDVTSDINGNCIITGEFSSSTITFGTYTLTHVGSPTTYDIFIVKLDPFGNVIWAKSYGNTGDDYGFSLDTDPSGNIFLSGIFSSASIGFGTTTLTTSTGNGSYIAKVDPNGNMLWAKDFGPVSLVASIAADNTGNIYVASAFNSTTTVFGTITFTNSSISNQNDLYIVKYDSNGNVVWGNSSSGVFSEEIKSVDTDNAGNVFITGLIGGSMSIGTLVLSNPGSYTSFVAKLDSFGNGLWIRPMSGALAYGLSTGNNGFVHLTGNFGPSATFGTTTITGTGNSNGFLAKYDTNGVFLWTTGFGANFDVYSLSVIANNSSGTYAYGYYTCSPTLSIGSTTLTNNGIADMFLAKINDLATGINESNSKKGSIIYPNPNNGDFILQMNTELVNGELILFNILGQKVFSQKIKQGEIEIKTQGLAKGLYHYSVLQNKEQVQTGKIVIE